MVNNNKKAKILLPDNKSIELPIISGSMGPDVIDITTLYRNTGMFTYDPGFTSTGSCQSEITFIDGDNGILLHRGYSIEYLAKNANFLETAYLLLYGDLPNDKKIVFCSINLCCVY